jgi:hypothetical protein
VSLARVKEHPLGLTEGGVYRFGGCRAGWFS